jgi:hypothetical protein
MSTRRLVLVALAAIVVLGALLRIPNLQTLPELTDETHEVLWGLSISRGQSLPLTDYRAYIGALYNYFLALVFRLVGSDPETPRLLMLGLGLATMPLVFLCVRRAHGTGAGLLAAALLAVSPVHVVVNSHIAWGNCATPLLTTLAFWFVYRALGSIAAGRGPAVILSEAKDQVRVESADLIPSAGSGQALRSAQDDRGNAQNDRGLLASPLPRTTRDPAWNLVPAALLLALALQTHPSVLAIFPGLALAVALARPGLLLSRWAPFALLAFLAGYANMIVFNLQNNFQSLRVAQQIRAEYAGAPRPFGDEYLANLGTLLLALFRMVGGAIEDRASPLSFLADPILVAAAVFVLAGLIWTASRGDRLPLLVAVSSVLLLPLFNDRYEPITDGRYLMPLLPLLFGATSRLALDALRNRRSVIRLSAAVAVAVLIVAPLISLRRYHEQSLDIVLRGARLNEAIKIAQANLPPGSSATLDRDLERVVLGAGSTELMAFEYAFTMRAVPYRIVRLTPTTLATSMAAQPTPASRLVIMDRAKRKLLDPRLQVRQLDADLPEKDAKPSSYAVYVMSWQARG